MRRRTSSGERRAGRRSSPPDEEKPAKRWPSSLLGQVATLVSVLSGVVGLVFLLNPDAQPERASAQRSATLAMLEHQPQLTRRMY